MVLYATRTAGVVCASPHRALAPAARPVCPSLKHNLDCQVKNLKRSLGVRRAAARDAPADEDDGPVVFDMGLAGEDEEEEESDEELTGEFGDVDIITGSAQQVCLLCFRRPAARVKGPLAAQELTQLACHCIEKAHRSVGRAVPRYVCLARCSARCGVLAHPALRKLRAPTITCRSATWPAQRQHNPPEIACDHLRALQEAPLSEPMSPGHADSLPGP